MDNWKYPDSVRSLRYCFNLVKGLGKATIRKLVGRSRFKQKRYFGRDILGVEETNETIRRRILSGQPYMVARFGDAELRAVVYYLNRQVGITKQYPEYIRVALSRNTGFFPVTDESIDHFAEIMLQSCSQIDMLAVWFNLMEDYVYNVFGPAQKQCVYLSGIESFWSKQPWTGALKGKKVLVIHPFAETIRRQYANREKLFQDPEVLPEFELLTLKAVQSLGGTSDRFETWFDALDWMYTEALSIDFDVAIVGCGAYGLPLAAKLKQSGKIAIHMGGVTQFLFGIKGKRWDERPEYAAFYNEYWNRPMETERPNTANQVENGCYW